MRKAALLPFLASAMMSLGAAAANAQNVDCRRGIPESLADNGLYVLEKGKWSPVLPGKTVNLSGSPHFAYTIDDDRENEGGVVLVKTVDFGPVQAEPEGLSVQLERNRFKRAKNRWLESNYGETPLIRYQDTHQNDREVTRELKSFHGSYLYRDGQERSTRDKRRLKAFAFEGFQLKYKQRSPLLAFIMGQAVADVQQRDTKQGSVNRLRAALKYYGRIQKVTQTAVCFSLDVAERTQKTRIYIQDFDYQGPSDLGVNPFTGRKSKWEVVWN